MSSDWLTDWLSECSGGPPLSLLSSFLHSFHLPPCQPSPSWDLNPWPLAGHWVQGRHRHYSGSLQVRVPCKVTQAQVGGLKPWVTLWWLITQVSEVCQGLHTTNKTQKELYWEAWELYWEVLFCTTRYVSLTVMITVTIGLIWQCFPNYSSWDPYFKRPWE